MKINELAGRLDVTPRAIRFYEEKGLLHPRYADNGYRFYTEDDAWRLQTITAFREIGFGIEAIAKLLLYVDSGDRDTFRHYLELQRAVLFSRWVEWKQLLAALDRLIDRADGQKPLQLDDLFELADNIRQLKHARSTWEDRWDYDGLAERFDRLSSQRMSPVGFMATADEYEQALAFTVQWIAPQPGETGLDVGTGTGVLAGRLQQEGAAMYAVEQSRQMLARCRGNYPDVQSKLGNFMALPFFEGEFHFIATHFAFHHLNEGQQRLALEEMNRVLRPQGRIVITGLMFEHAEAREVLMSRLEREGDRERLSELTSRYPADRSGLLEWFRSHGFITIQQQLNEWIHMVYAVRKH
ncbi:MerR family transcriptional regulator [Paenibacillus sp. H1-7]|uniref:MerR family transcriptional regulator n=1 Tax=Paenibacillus sp. H1-7 TaxID=2282849 RepID=UPI001EF89CC8|nr:MerR family transcriptional regulator [Paenibacillus sp. H1-7]ULL18729.1 MerR family transcriptional regulator [Paenibacillus sp. H1-7]